MVTPRKRISIERMVSLETFTISAAEFKLLKRKGRLRIFLLDGHNPKTYRRFMEWMMQKRFLETIKLGCCRGLQNHLSSAQNGCFCFITKQNSTNKVKPKSGFSLVEYIHALPSTSSTNVSSKKKFLQIDDVDIEEMDINWQIAMIAIRMKKFYKKTGRRVRVDGKTPVGFDKKKLECFNCHNTSHFARECTAKGTYDGKKKRDSPYQTIRSWKQEKIR
ncbi:ribonuclease H-like domain-containing protein [Tanacetum coccineum]